MGQRTAIIVQKHEKTRNGETKISTRVFYEQWGIGRIMPMELMTILNLTIGNSVCSEYYLELLKPACMYDKTESFNDKKLNSLGFDTPADIGDVFSILHNNNGGIFVRFYIDEYDLKGIEYAYMLGSEEGDDYASLCTEEEWMQKAGGACLTDEFKALYRHTIDYFNAKQHVEL